MRNCWKILGEFFCICKSNKRQSCLEIFCVLAMSYEVSHQRSELAQFSFHTLYAGCLFANDVQSLFCPSALSPSETRYAPSSSSSPSFTSLSPSSLSI